MSNDSIKKIIERIRKCMALASSSEPHEAAAALRQAQKLMELHGITEDQLRMADVSESMASAGRAVSNPPVWLTQLAGIVSDAFGVSHFYRDNGIWKPGEFAFIGVGATAQVASYVFTILRRKCADARRSYYRKCRGSRGGRVSRADAFAFGWVRGVEMKIEAFAKETPKIVGEYIRERHVHLVDYKPTDRRDLSNGRHTMEGYEAGSDIDLYHGVNGVAPLQLTEDK